MHALAPEVPADLRGVGGVQPDADLRGEPVLLAVVGETALDGHGAGHGGVRRVEADEEPVAGGHHLLALMGGKQ